MLARQILTAAPGALLVASLASSASAAGPPRRLRAGSPAPSGPGSCVTVGNTAPCHCVCRCDGEVVGARTFTADELTAQGDGYCSTAGADNLTAPCVRFCWGHRGSCGSSLEDSSVGTTCTSIGDLPEVSANASATTTADVTTATTATFTSTTALDPSSLSSSSCGGIDEPCWINQDCCSARCSLTLRCRPVR